MRGRIKTCDVCRDLRKEEGTETVRDRDTGRGEKFKDKGKWGGSQSVRESRGKEERL